jgi:hypothetical protein
MKPNLLKFALLHIFLFVTGINLMSQPQVSVYTDLGQNNVSEGLFIKSAGIVNYNLGRYKAEMGCQFDLKNNKRFDLSGFTIDATRYFQINKIPLELHGFYTWTIPSEILLETNWGMLLKMRHNRFEMALGTNLRTYNLRQIAVSDYEIENKSTRIHEIYNIMYSFSYSLKPTDDHWNAGLSITNIDHFIINQETNPAFNLYGIYKLSSPACLYAQACYKIAGFSNMELNQFGFCLRIGLIWNIK